MAGFQVPGPLGIGAYRPLLDVGTLARAPLPPPGPAREGPAAHPAAAPAALPVVAEARPTAVEDPAIEALNLAETARTAAYALKRAHPAVVFTSGRRGVADQARAMAGNVVRNRQWIVQTYAESDLRAACQAWVDTNPTALTREAVAAGLLGVLKAATDAQLDRFSKHLSGRAFDVQPTVEDAAAIKATIRGLPGLDKFLDMEGGLVRWHAQF